MSEQKSLAEILHQLSLKGYQPADVQQAGTQAESILSDDWKLDEVRQIKPGFNTAPSGQMLVIAVSSVKRRLKLVFVETVSAQNAFSPINLLRRLFPLQARKNSL